MYKKRSPSKQMTRWSEKSCTRLMRSAIIRRASQDEQQNQTKTTNINYMQNLCPRFLKKNLITRSK